ncbi:MAG: hypothetical protein AAGF19_09210, partial [Pseudomonadota bacterium]
KNCSTNNVLISKSIFIERGLRFDEGFGLSGGSDTEFFVRSRTEGARFAIAPDALVHEEVPLARLHWRWRLGRIISRSNAQVRIRIKHGGYWRSFARYLPRGVWLVLAAIVTLPGLLGPSFTARERVLKRFGSGVGMLKALIGSWTSTYARIEGR